MSYTKFHKVEKKDIIKAIKVCEQYFSKNKILFMNQDIVKLSSQISSISGLDFTSSPESIIISMIVENCFRNEKIAPGSFFPSLKIMRKRLEDSSFESPKNILKFRPTKEEIIEYCSSITGYSVANIAMELCEKSGPDIRIFNKGAPNSKDDLVFSMTEGHYFSCKRFESEIYELKNPKVFLADAFIESVSEIDGLLKSCHETKESFVLICRGAHQDIQQTFITNRIRGTLKAHLIFFPTELSTINVFSDLGMIINTLPHEKSQGRLTSSYKWEELPYVDKILLSGQKMNISHAGSSGRVHAKLNEVSKKIEDSFIEDQQQALLSRLDYLMPDKVNIYFKEDEKSYSLKEDLDRSIRIIISARKKGFVDVPQNLLDCFKTSKVTTESFLAALLSSERVFNIGGVNFNFR